MAVCDNCQRCSCRVYPQPSRPMDTSHRPILVIGESLTALEAKRNTVMEGAGAQVLRDTMAKVGMPSDSAHVHFTVAVMCAVPKKKGNNTFPKDASVNCRTRLLEEIRAVNPQLILVCGKTAIQTLTGDQGIKVTEEYGRVREYPFLPGMKVMPIMNPGVIIRSPGEYKPFLAMMQLASSIYRGGSTYSTGTVEWEVLDTEQKCLKAWQDMHHRHEAGTMPFVSMDIETTSLDYRIAEVLVVGICYEKNKVYVIPREMNYILHNFFGNVPWRTVWQGGKYDTKVLWRRALGTVNLDEDTMYLHYVLDETSAHDLGYLSKVFLQAEEYKYKMNQQWKAVTLERYKEFFEALCERVAVDCDYTYQLKTVLEAECMKVPSLYKLYKELLIPAASFLSRVEQNGLLIDPPYLDEMKVKYEALLEKMLFDVEELAAPLWNRELYMHQTGAKSAPERFNPGAPLQMAWMVFDRLKLKPRIKKGRSTAKEILGSLDPQPALVKQVLEYRKVQKELSTYVIGLLEAQDDDGRVRTNFTLHVAATGRLTSKEPNVQNQSAANGVGNVRKAFIAPKLRLLGEIDYSGAELRWMAFLSKCPVLSEVFIEGRNLHDETAKALFGLAYTAAEKLRAKAVNFGIPYGREDQSFVDEFNITKEEAHAMVQGWLDKYYGCRDYLEWCADQVVAGNYLETPFGRRRRFGLVTKESLHALRNEARNFPIQSSSSDLLLVSAMAMEKPLLHDFDTKICNLVHDSAVLDMPADENIIKQVGFYANQVMINKPIELFNCHIPFKTDFEIGLNWGSLVTYDYVKGCIVKEVKKEINGVKQKVEVELDFQEWYKEALREVS